jgi:tetratricopeptide (TPR) repeat protein
VQEIDARFVQNDAESLTIREAWPKIFQGVASPDDLAGALERLNALAANPMNPELSSLGTERRRMEGMVQAWEAAKRGDNDSALKALDRAGSSGGFDDASNYYEPLKSRILSTVMQRKTQGWSKLTLNPGEDPTAFLGRILDELQAKGDYTTMVEVMKFSDQMSRQNATGALTAERQAMERFLAGQRLEAAGDPLGAMTNYRNVIASAGGKYVPTAQAQEAFKKLQEKNPDLFKSGDAVILEEIRSLKMLIQSLMGRMGPGRPPYPMPGQ